MTAQATLNRYGSLCAEIYDIDKPPGALFDIPHYTAILKSVTGPVLEAAVGTGRIFVPLLQAGFDMYGFDHSAHMLAICRHNAQTRGYTARVHQARFTDFAYEHEFGAIIVPTSTIILIDDFDTAMSVLRRFHAHLRPGGLLALDIPPMDFFGPAPERARAWTAPNGDLLRMEAQLVDIDVVRQRRVEHDRYERWRDGKLIESELEVFAYRSWGLQEFELALRAAGFEIRSIGANFQPGRKPKSGDRIFNFIAAKPG